VSDTVYGLIKHVREKLFAPCVRERERDRERKRERERGLHSVH